MSDVMPEEIAAIMKPPIGTLVPFTQLELAKQVVSTAMPVVGESGVNLIGYMLLTCCVRCDIRDTCDVAYEPYNQGCEPKIDCLATK